MFMAGLRPPSLLDYKFLIVFLYCVKWPLGPRELEALFFLLLRSPLAGLRANCSIRGVLSDFSAARGSFPIFSFRGLTFVL